uniref:Protein NRDE2 homolog isoform X1 n=1 Tax=Elaeis guineensis var. tenera TaxID=51953 RepID=A0A6I9QYP7_ELAGV|nr:protein NRDE2 homolog isoform X1 [Elaeis guineensis]
MEPDAEKNREGRTDEGGRGEEARPNSPTPSLFPVFPLSSNPSLPPPSSSTAPQWLSNPSFTFDVSSLTGSGGAAAVASFRQDSDSEDEAAAEAAPSERLPTYDLVASSPSASSSEEHRRSKRKEGRRKKKRRRREGEGWDDGASRKSGVRAWVGSDTKPAKDYYFDLRGDRDNLAFGSLYRMDVARYKLQNRTEFSGINEQLFYCWKPSNSCVDVDGDLDVLDSKVRAGGRYYSVKYIALERNKGFKHVKIVEKTPSMIPGEFIPLAELHSSPENGKNVSITKGEVEESWEDELIQRTRELNKMSREFPHDEKVWLAFAEFQDKIASTQPQKAARLQTLEKKIGILEKAVELNPDNEELLLCLLKSYQGRDSTDALIGKWEKILMQHSDSCKLWKEFLLLCQGEFSRFKVSEVRKIFAHAIQAISSACSKLCRQGSQTNSLQSVDSSLVQLELGLVDIFASLCRFEWQTGYQELATGLFQAEIEYSLFCPSLLLSSQSKQRLFEHFWNSDGARIGEDGALGWSLWLEKEELNRKNIFTEQIPQETEEGGWTGWFDPSSKKTGTSKELENSMESSLGDEKIEENPDTEDTPLEDDIQTLLKKLGINVDAEPNSEVKDAKTWNRWSEEELSRDHEQWMPVREHSGDDGKSRSPPDDNPDKDGHEQLSRVILFEDVSEYIFSLSSEEARFSLVCQFIDFYGGKISQWACTNRPSWTEKILSLETVPDSILEDLRVVFGLVNKTEAHAKLEHLLHSTSDLSRRTNMMKFLRNTILLFLNVFPRNHMLEEAVLSAEELFMSKESSSTFSVNPSRTLAKSLLKRDRQDLLLCGVYARSEATYGNIDLARKIFDMALSSIDGLPMDLRENVPLLYFWYAEMEVAASTSCSNSELSLQRAVHILSCLGGNMKYTPFKCQTSGLQLLRARQGFKEQIKSLLSAWARGDIKEHSVAYICSASLFEALTTGWSAGIEVIEQAFAMALPERRSRSLQLESLWVHHIGVLQRHLKQLRFSRVWEAIAQGFQIYPYNPKPYIAMIEASYLYTVPNKVRIVFDECGQRNPSVILWLFAFSFELGKAGSQHRIHGLFERALANDKLQKSVLLWRCYLSYEADIAHNPSAARRIFFRAIHACPWSKRLWLDGFQKLGSVLTAKELSDLQEVMRDKELHLRTDIYEILLEDEIGI